MSRRILMNLRGSPASPGIAAKIFQAVGDGGSHFIHPPPFHFKIGMVQDVKGASLQVAVHVGDECLQNADHGNRYPSVRRDAR